MKFSKSVRLVRKVLSFMAAIYGSMAVVLPLIFLVGMPIYYRWVFHLFEGLPLDQMPEVQAIWQVGIQMRDMLLSGRTAIWILSVAVMFALTYVVLHSLAKFLQQWEQGPIDIRLGIKRSRFCVRWLLVLVVLNVLSRPLFSYFLSEFDAVLRQPLMLQHIPPQSVHPILYGIGILFTPQFGGMTGITLAICLYLLANSLEDRAALEEEAQLTI